MMIIKGNDDGHHQQRPFLNLISTYDIIIKLMRSLPAHPGKKNMLTTISKIIAVLFLLAGYRILEKVLILVLTKLYEFFIQHLIEG
jgi:hypothetical protein